MYNLVDFRSRDAAVKSRALQKILISGQALVEFRTLDNGADLRDGLFEVSVEIFAVDQYNAGGRLDEAEKETDGGCFSCAVRYGVESSTTPKPFKNRQ